MRYRVIDGLSIRFVESENRGTPALLLSPWPESLLAFTPIWERLAERAHLVAIDLPGFGHSQRRDDLMSAPAMGEFVIRAADAFGLDHPDLIGPGLATGATLFAAAGHPGRLRSLVVGSDAGPDLGPRADGGPRELVGALLAGINQYQLPDAVREDYLSAYDGDRFLASTAYGRDVATLRDLLPGIRTPVRIIVGAHDPSASPANAEFLHRRLPNSALDVVDAGHFTWEDAAEKYAALVLDWWTGVEGVRHADHP
jgi:pimeloyl-ACP methyl ester carboxylesterase